jgi:predicted negative regulator of RcsB-dependent stress response
MYTSYMKNKYFSSRAFIVVIIAIVVLLVSLICWQLYSQKADSNPQSPSQINSFDECVAAGNAVMESYPEQCAANGKTFTKQY